jgi:hypothetical protein
MLKTVTSYEREVFLQVLEDYYWHVTNNQDSLIAKILGVFKFTGFETGEISFVLMKNIAKVPKQWIHRTYDIKGSTFDREVLRGFGEVSSNDEMTKVLKDKDFLRLEGRLGISERDRILGQLDRDTLFLK